jgi:PAS domain S-box-containing protein
MHRLLQNLTFMRRRIAAALSARRQLARHDVALFGDIEARKRSAGALLRSEERLGVAMEATDLGTFEWDIPEDRVRYSPNVKRFFGFTEHTEVTLEDVLARVHSEDREPVRATIHKALDPSGPRTYAGEFRTIEAKGNIAWVDCRGAVIFSSRGNQPQCVVGIVIDITERREREMQLRRDAADLDASNRFKDEFMATLAHELRNPLTPIRNGLEILRLQGLATADQRRACDAMNRQVRHIVRLVDDLLDVSRLSQRKLRLKKQTVSVQQLIENVVEALQSQIDAAGHALTLCLPERPVFVHVDPVRIVQAIGNLLSNSIRYTPSAGKIDVSARLAQGGVEIRVIDNGIGITPALLPRLFDMFSQDEEHHSEAGLGIGLALTKALVEMHDGKIAAQSEGAGAGSMFCVWLATTEEHSSSERLPEMTLPTTGPTRRVLVVDDDADAADSTAALLSLMGHEVHEARDGLQAIEAVRKLSPEIVLMDIGMPGLDGTEAARRIRRSSAAMPPTIVALTGWDAQRLQPNAGELIFDGHLTKPVDASALAQVLRELPDASTGTKVTVSPSASLV